MTDDEHERLARGLETLKHHAPWATIGLDQAAAQLRADGERIKALEAALTKFAAQQERLGPEFEAAIYADLEGLYSNDQKPGGEGE